MYLSGSIHVYTVPGQTGYTLELYRTERLNESTTLAYRASPERARAIFEAEVLLIAQEAQHEA